MRLIVVASPSEIPAVRRWLLDAVQEMRRQFQLEDPGAASSLGHCERWALTLAFTPTTRAG
jgi:hypothetical protein